MPFVKLPYGGLQCLVSIPGGVRPPEGWPILVFLHGVGESAQGPRNFNAAMTLHGPLRPANDQVATQDFVVVAPQLPVQGDANTWGDQDHAPMLSTIVREVRK